ncbi:MAG: fibronectin type III domain-containing protein [Firmicutes bacterium]|nr:fibronectin type III domain-containing protein [Bacillota bacterium]
MVMKKKGIAAVIAFLLVLGATVCIGGTQKTYAAEDSYRVDMFGMYCQIYGNGYDKEYFAEDETPNLKLVYYWTRFHEGLFNSDATMDLNDFWADYVKETFATCSEPELEAWLIERSGKDYFTYDAEKQQITLTRMVGVDGGLSASLKTVSDDTWNGDGEIYCSWTNGSDLLQRMVMKLEDGAIVSFLPEEKVYQINVAEEVFDDTLRGLPGETLTIHASLVDYYQSDMIENPVESATLRWSLDGKVLAENAESVDVTLPNKEAREELLIEALLPETGEGADPVSTYRLDLAASQCNLSISGREFGAPKDISLKNALSLNKPYLFFLNGGTWGWDYGNTGNTPFYEWSITGPDKKTVTIKQNAYEGGKTYGSFNDNYAIFGGGCPDRILTFKVPGKYTIKGTIYRQNKVFRTCAQTVNAALPQTAVAKLTKAKKAITVKWTAKTEGGVTGYQIMLATNSKFTKGKKTVNINGAKKTSVKVKKLKAKKKYYVKIRTVAKVAGKTYYSTWSKAKSVKTK